MKRRLLISVLALAVILIAAAGWTVDGARWALGAARA
jgi:predicted small secreted protein